METNEQPVLENKLLFRRRESNNIFNWKKTALKKSHRDFTD